MMTVSPRWPDTSTVDAPTDGLYRSATWLLGRHPRLARLAARIEGVVGVEDDQVYVDLEHLARVISAVPSYAAAWDRYERAHPAPVDEDAWEEWAAGVPDPDAFIAGLSDLLPMSSGELAALRLLATLGYERAPFHVCDFRSFDRQGQWLLADWMEAIYAIYGPVAPAPPPRRVPCPDPAVEGSYYRAFADVHPPL